MNSETFALDPALSLAAAKDLEVTLYLFSRK